MSARTKKPLLLVEFIRKLPDGRAREVGLPRPSGPNSENYKKIGEEWITVPVTGKGQR